MTTALRRRAAAARRLEPLDSRHGLDLGARDPIASWPTRCGPSTYGMTPGEIRREAERMLAGGWASWEIVCTLVSPEQAA